MRVSGPAGYANPWDFEFIESIMSTCVPTALIVEDEPQIRRFVRMALETEGWRVFESETLQRGLIDAGRANRIS